MRCRRQAWARLAAMARDGISAAVAMRPYEDGNERRQVYGCVLDGARKIRRNELEVLDLCPQESLWLHWGRSVLQARQWLREASGLDEFACDLLLGLCRRSASLRRYLAPPPPSGTSPCTNGGCSSDALALM